MIVLGLGGALGHDAAAALVVDGVVVAAAEEERFSRQKQARGALPEAAARFCLEAAGLQADQLDAVAIPYAPIALRRRDRWHYAARYWYAPDRGLDALLNGNRRYRRFERRIRVLGTELGIDWNRTSLRPVEHHLAHASSAYHLSGFEGPTAILSIDGKGEYATTLCAYGDDGVITPVHAHYDPDSLCGLYGAITEYLGFAMLEGEYKVMGMAAYGDPEAIDLSPLVTPTKTGFRIATELVNTIGLRRYKHQGRGYYFSRKLIDWLGPPRSAQFDPQQADDRFVNIAAALQALFEQHSERLVDLHLAPTLAHSGQLAIAGGGGLNVKLNQRLRERADVKHLFVQPAAGDSGTALGAATFVAAGAGDRFSAMTHAYLGPAHSSADCEAAIQRAQRSSANALRAEHLSDPVSKAADLLAAGHPVAWLQGAMEFGPRALGARSILGNPASPGIAERINGQIKFREPWRPFCPSVLEEQMIDLTGVDCSAPFMTITFDVLPAWQQRVPEVVHVDGSARIQTVSATTHPRYHALLQAMRARTGSGVLLNTSLNRRGEPLINTPEEALTMFCACDLHYLIMEDWLVTKATTTG